MPRRYLYLYLYFRVLTAERVECSVERPPWSAARNGSFLWHIDNRHDPIAKPPKRRCWSLDAHDLRTFVLPVGRAITIMNSRESLPERLQNQHAGREEPSCLHARPLSRRPRPSRLLSCRSSSLRCQCAHARPTSVTLSAVKSGALAAARQHAAYIETMNARGSMTRSCGGCRLASVGALESSRDRRQFLFI